MKDTVKIHRMVTEMLSEQLGLPIEKIKPESRIEEDLNADSLDLVEITMAIEEDFQLYIRDEDAEKLKTVGDILNYLETHTDDV